LVIHENLHIESAMTTGSQKKTSEPTQATGETQALQAQAKMPEPKEMPVFAIEAGTLTVQEWTRKVSLPERFYLEADADLRPMQRQ
jgi:hypothetical protein